VPEPQQGKRETSGTHGPKLSDRTAKKLRAINRAPEIVGKLFGIEYQTAAQAVRVCKAIGSFLRRKELSFHHHKEVAGRDDKIRPIGHVLPTKESHVRELLKLEVDEHRAEVWRRVV